MICLSIKRSPTHSFSTDLYHSDHFVYSFFIYYFAKFLQSIVLTQVFGVCVCVCVCHCVCVSNNFLLYSITKTILPGSSPHLVKTFLTSIHSFLLIWAHLENKMAAMPIFLFNFFPLTFYWRLATSQQSSFSCLFNQCTLTTYFLWKEDRIT